MDLNKLWVKDPDHNNKLSVSLTIMIISIIFLMVTGVMQVLDMVKSTGPFLEFTYSSMALYFGRKLSAKGNMFSSESAQKIEEKVEKAVEENS
jgi:hypothetical protein